MGAAISMAAGCSADSVISYMQRAHLTKFYDQVFHLHSTDDTFRQSLTARSASLRQLVPKSGLPEQARVTLEELQAWICISASEAKSLSPEAKAKFDAEVKATEHVLVGLWHCVGDPVQRWVDPYPDWLDRIAYLQRLLKRVQSLPIIKAAQPIQTDQTPKMDALQKSLTSLQASEHWPQAVKCMEVKDLNAQAKYSTRLSIRECSEAYLTSEISQMLSAKHGWISWKQACFTKFCSLTERL